MNAQPPARPRNRRGEGTRLRDEILRTTAAMIARAGSSEAVTLRSVAREVGIAAPSIYGHFADRDAIIEAVAVDAIGRLHRAVLAAIAAKEDPVDALIAGCIAYVEFGTREPALYSVLFGTVRPELAPAASGAEALSQKFDSFQTLVESLTACVRAGRSVSTDPFRDAVLIWTALHGRVTLRATMPHFPWPGTDTVAEMTQRLGQIIPTPD